MCSNKAKFWAYTALLKDLLHIQVQDFRAYKAPINIFYSLRGP